VKLRGISSMATRRVLEALAPAYRAASVEVESIGGVDAERRVESGEALDFVVLAAAAIDRLATAERVHREGSVDLARSGMAIAVRAGAGWPDIASEVGVRAAIASARGVGYSTGPSGKHLLKLIERWGLASVRLVAAPPGVPVATLLARGDADIGFQQMSELLDMPGIEIVGPMPPEIQEVTVFRAAVCTASTLRKETEALLACFASPSTAEIKRRCGMEPGSDPGV
jgi:molybdate transport system substrate-binding protein